MGDEREQWLCIEAISVAVEDGPEYVPVQRVSTDHRPGQVRLPRQGPCGVARTATVGEDVGERALRALGRVDPPLPFALVRAGVTVFSLLAASVAGAPGAVALVVDCAATARGDGPPIEVTEAAEAAVALRLVRGTGPVRMTAWGEGAPPIDVLAKVAHVFSGTSPCDGWLAMHSALRESVVGDGDRVLLRVGRGTREAWAQLDVADVARLHLGGGAGGC